MAEDLVRAVKEKAGTAALSALDRLISRFLARCSAKLENECRSIESLWAAFKRKVSSTGVEQLHYDGRSLLSQLEIILCVCLLMYDASIGKDRVSTHIAKRYALSNMSVEEVAQERRWMEAVALDREIFMGHETKTLSMA